MNLSTKYMGLELKNPLVPSASPLMKSLDNIKKLEDAGASAVVLHSLFEEQISDEALEMHYHTTQGTESFAEALSYFPEPSEYFTAKDEYLKYVGQVKESTGIPVIASLNGTTKGGWAEYAKHMQEAGADAIELNLYYIATDPDVGGAALEAAYLETLKAVVAEVKIPVAVKLSPFFTSLPAMAKSFVESGASGLVLFNRFYQPDLNVEHLKVESNIVLSDSHSIRLPLRWISILHGKLDASFAATGGVHNAIDAVKLLMAGADVTMMCSALLRNGVDYLNAVLNELEEWLTAHEYESVEQIKGSMSQKSVAEPAAFERAMYIKEISSHRW